MITHQQALYLKEYLTLRNTGDGVSRIGASLFDSKISLNPHQINAALSFFHNPKSKGTIFADEVGLGKTIEAGIVISQYWYEHKRKIIVITPASLMKQWNEELYDKFALPSRIIDSKIINNPEFRIEDNIYICSINTAYLYKEKMKANYDLVVIDEAHKLRNVYKDKGVMAPAIKELFQNQKKLLLTATPFQNNLMELYGIMSLIDENIFPDVKFFREKYINGFSQNKEQLKETISKYLIRTLRKDVTKYINYTKRHVMVSDYLTSDKEKELYAKITNLMYSDDFSESYTKGQNQLLIILLQKLLSSSTYAVCSTLKRMACNLKLDDTQDVCDDEDENAIDIDILNSQTLIDKINSTISFAETIEQDSKFERLVQQLNTIYEEFEKDQTRNKKILIFTESKQTQMYLYEKLKNSDKFNNVIYFNGDNSLANENLWIYKDWEEKQIIKSQNKAANIRKAIIDAFEKHFEIMIATDAAAEGLNIQFCSVMINYDLPWNPQKIEQRIGRCHRYGQKNDVLIVNMLNRNSSIDQRIYELLNYKLGIFEETFGSSDAVLGNTSIADDIENAIKNIYLNFRNPEEIENEFKNLQKKFESEIEAAIKKSELDLETYFDEEVRNAFDLQYIEATKVVNEYEEVFGLLIDYLLPESNYKNHRFNYRNITYTTSSTDNEAVFCSISSELGSSLLECIKNNDFECDSIDIDYSSLLGKIGFLDNIKSTTGEAVISKITYESFETNEAIVITAQLDDGTIIPQDVMHKLLKCEGKYIKNIGVPGTVKQQEDLDKKINEIEKYNSKLFKEELSYIDNWADSLIESIQMAVSDMREEKRELQLKYSLSTDISEQTKIQEEINILSRKISKSWYELGEKENEIEDKRTRLINNLKAEKNKKITCNELFRIRFKIS